MIIYKMAALGRDLQLDTLYNYCSDDIFLWLLVVLSSI